MGLLDRMRSNTLPPKQNTTTKLKNQKFAAIGNVEPICPYCNYRFDKMPQSKKKCPNCNNFVRSRTRPLDNKKVLIKESQIEEIEAQWAIKNGQPDSIALGGNLSQRQEEWKKIANHIMMNNHDFEGLPHDTSKNIRSIIADGIIKEKKIGEISRDIVNKVEGVSIERATEMVHAETAKAVNAGIKDKYKHDGVKKLEWLAVIDDATCTACKKLDGQMFPIDKVPECPAHPGCRCTLLPVVELPEGDWHD